VKALAQRNVCKLDGPQTQRVYQENSYRKLLAAFVSGLDGVSGRHVPFSKPQTIQQALSIALNAEQAENKNDPMIAFQQNLKLRSEIRRKPHTDIRSARA
jgi:hypothetical protein